MKLFFFIASIKQMDIISMTKTIRQYAQKIMPAKMLIAKACLLPESRHATKSGCLWNIKSTTFNKSEVFNLKVYRLTNGNELFEDVNDKR